MKRFDWRIVLISIGIFIVPPLAIPASGVLTEGITEYTYGFPFSWFSVYFSSRGGKAFLVQALSEPHSGIHISIISAVMNLLIIYIVLNAIVKVFGKNKPGKNTKNSPEPPPEKKGEPPTGPSDESDAQSKESSPPAD